MRRNTEKAINEYDEMRKRKGSRFGTFYFGDIQEIQALHGQSNSEMIFAAMRFGFVVGYHSAIRERRNKVL